MPVVFRLDGYRFHFYSNEGDPREPVHIHVVKDGADAKLWLSTPVEFAYNHGFDARTQRWLCAAVEAHHDEIEDAWHAHFS